MVRPHRCCLPEATNLPTRKTSPKIKVEQAEGLDSPAMSVLLPPSCPALSLLSWFRADPSESRQESFGGFDQFAQDFRIPGPAGLLKDPEQSGRIGQHDVAGHRGCVGPKLILAANDLVGLIPFRQGLQRRQRGNGYFDRTALG